MAGSGVELAQAWISVVPSFKGGQKAIVEELGGAGDPAGKKAGAGFASGFKALVGPAIALVSTAAIGGFVKDSIAVAGDLEQSVGAVDAVFKGSAVQMHGWAKSAANDVGLTANEFNELGTLIGAQLKNGGTAMEDLAPKTNELVNLGADMASMFGGSTADAVGALSSALKGERDPIEAYGVSLKQASIDAKAAEMGFEKVGGSLSDEAQQAATLALIMDQTSDAHGNFAKESSTYAGQVQRLSAGWGDLQASIGTLFLPVMTSAVGLINSSVMPALAGLVAMVGSGGLAGAFAPIAAIAGPIFTEISGGMTAMVAAFKDGEDQITSSGLAGFLEGVGVVARNVFDAFGPALMTIGASFGALIPDVIGLVSQLSPLSMIFKALTPLLPTIATLLSQVGGTLGGLIGSALMQVQPLVDQFVNTLSTVFMAAVPALNAMLLTLSGAFQKIAPAIFGVLGAVMPLVSSLLGSLLPIIVQLVQSVLPPVVSIFGNVVNAIAPLITIIAGLLIPIIAALLPVVTTVFGVIASIITSVMGIIQGIIQVVTGIITGNWSMAWDGIVNIITGAIDLISGIIGGIKDIVLSALSGAGSWLVSVGEDIINGLLNGISNLAGTIGQFFLDLLPGWIVGPFKVALGINSPSKVFAGFGENIGEGVVNGVDGMKRKVGSAVEGMVTVPQAASYEPAASGAGVAGGPAVQQIIQPAPGMSEHTIGRIAADSLNYQLRRAH